VDATEWKTGSNSPYIKRFWALLNCSQVSKALARADWSLRDDLRSAPAERHQMYVCIVIVHFRTIFLPRLILCGRIAECTTMEGSDDRSWKCKAKELSTAGPLKCQYMFAAVGIRSLARPLPLFHPKPFIFPCHASSSHPGYFGSPQTKTKSDPLSKPGHTAIPSSSFKPTSPAEPSAPPPIQHTCRQRAASPDRPSASLG
jgi:hypothetical protein